MSPARRAAVAANKPSHLRAVLWDLDGTLTDSVRLVVETMNWVIAAHGGPPLPYEKAGALTGLPLDAMFRLAWPDAGDDDVDRYRVEYRTRYDAVAMPATRLYRGARAALRDFHASGLLQATVTGKRAADCERILR
ncbi:MAG TPA: HAD hydrolase-like protein, partial [Candidatus Polarisedimenticolia bacterium]|nr:HAD hydrolase-like protein [Candidatus Polarisedimenticolia bacterium]